MKALWYLCFASWLFAAEVQILQGIDHGDFDRLLKIYVDENSNRMVKIPSPTRATNYTIGA